MRKYGFAATAALIAFGGGMGTARAQATANSATTAATEPGSPFADRIGKPAPDFSLPDQENKAHRLSDLKGKWVVLAFYPADKTKG